MKNKQSDMKLIIEELPMLLKLFIGTIACFLILFGIHWIAILVGLFLGLLYYLLPKKY